MSKQVNVHSVFIVDATPQKIASAMEEMINAGATVLSTLLERGDYDEASVHIFYSTPKE